MSLRQWEVSFHQFTGVFVGCRCPFKAGRPRAPLVLPGSLVRPANCPGKGTHSRVFVSHLSVHPPPRVPIRSCHAHRRPLLLPLFAVLFQTPPSFVDYFKFCGAVEPRTGGRDLDNQRRVLDKAWKAKAKEPTSKTNPLSGRAPSRQQHSAGHPLSGRSWQGDNFGGGREHIQSVRFKRPPYSIHSEGIPHVRWLRCFLRV